MSEIIGVLFAIFVGMMIFPKFADFQTISNENTRAATTAQQQKQLNTAVAIYIQQNSVAIQAIATPTAPAQITVAMLQAPAVNLLPASFSATNPYGQTWVVEVLEPTLGNLQALAMSTGGTALLDAQASKIATLVGATGGFIPQNDSGIYPSYAYGAFSGWTIPSNTPVPGYSGVGGHLAALLTFNNGQLVSNYLYRNAVPGQPQLNTMSTPLIMADVKTIGVACTTNGAISQDGNGAVLSCQAGLWKAQGDGKCVGTTSNLDFIQDDGRCYNAVGNANSPAGGDWFFLEVYRHINTGNYYTVQRVMGMTGAAAGKVWHRNQQSGVSGTGWSAWVQQADNKVTIWDQPAEGGVVSIAGNDGTKMHIETLSGGTIRLVNSGFTEQLASVDQSGNLTMNQSGATNVGYVNPGWAVETWGCAGSGSIAKSAYTIVDGWSWSGKPLACLAGVWRRSVQSTGDTMTGPLSMHTDDWAVVLRNGGGGDNAQPQNPVGSAYVNDVYIRSIGKWASQLGGSTINFAGAYRVNVGDGGWCPGNHVAVGVGGFYATYTAGYIYCAPVY